MGSLVFTRFNRSPLCPMLRRALGRVVRNAHQKAQPQTAPQVDAAIGVMGAMLVYYQLEHSETSTRDYAKMMKQSVSEIDLNVFIPVVAITCWYLIISSQR